jgi:hypothetical protein
MSQHQYTKIPTHFCDAYPTGNVFHTYSTYARGDEGVLTTYFYLDLTPKGRNETGPGGNLGDWVRHHDRYGAGGYVDRTGGMLPRRSRKAVVIRKRADHNEVTYSGCSMRL